MAISAGCLDGSGFAVIQFAGKGIAAVVRLLCENLVRREALPDGGEAFGKWGLVQDPEVKSGP